VAERDTADKGAQVSAMFTRIARRYDLMNSVMTGGRHHAWRHATARAVAGAPAGPLLDLATGTCDLALALRRELADRLVVGADFSEGMLAEGRRKLDALHERRTRLVAADALALPFPDRTFACVTSAFLLRNLADLPRGLAEMRRVTRSGGIVAALEIVRPALPGWRGVFGFGFGRVVPALGALIARDRQAYTYLPRSVQAFVTPAELGRLMRDLGFRDVSYRRLGLGAIALHRAVV
jgi:demethylmenaquinone methyltransferase/2-methoxy-6-polyprenyl-1,4-benzoquinol methylase